MLRSYPHDPRPASGGRESLDAPGVERRPNVGRIRRLTSPARRHRKPAVRVDLLTSIAGVDFDEAWPQRVMTHFNGEEYPTLSREHRIQNKKAAGRPKDLNDALWLEQNQSEDS